ncbi:MAG TPA: OmpA family protein [Puia sp.]|uniref:OmpA family protein n=1 Tax=Puia sp. TaxID=2045100 RepID=UPI002B990052|nr:OmpA family protein [Puia sp.]HVU96516.1 OmpA family protein [Puia sp.]
MQWTACFVIANFIGLLMVTPAAAQEFGVELDGGLQGTHYTLTNGQTQPLLGGALGLRYGFRLTPRWNLVSGVSGGIYRTRASLHDGVAYSAYQVDETGSAFRLDVSTTGYRETQRFFAVSIPLLLQFHTSDPIVQWYFEGGAKLFVPFSTHIDVSAKQLVLSGYYPDYNIEISNLPQHGFGTINNWQSTATAQLRPAAALSAATGASFSLAPGIRVYAGVYLDYGLTGLKARGDSTPIATYHSTGLNGVEANSVLNGPGAGKMTLLAFGVQLRLGFGSGRSKPVSRASRQAVKDTLTTEELDEIQEPLVFGLLGETALPEIQKRHLDEVAGLLKRFPAVRISIAGYICNSETETEEKKVGVDRAAAVARYLQSNGIDAGRMEVSPVAVSEVFDPSNPLANYRSRRAVIKVL